MEELKHELEKLSKTYVDTPEKEEKILIPFIKRLLELSVKERRKLLPTIRELQWIKGKFSENLWKRLIKRAKSLRDVCL